MSNLEPSIVPLQAGLDLQSPKLIAQPGSMLDCVNYEIIDKLGYSRIDGFTRYDGTPYFVDINYNNLVYLGETTTISGTAPTLAEGVLTDAITGEIVGYAVEAVAQGAGTNISYVLFNGNSTTGRTLALSGTSWTFKTPTSTTTRQITQAEKLEMEAALRALVVSLPYTPIGLHWFRSNLFAVVPMLMIPYKASAVNTVVSYQIGATLATTFSAGTATLRDKIVVTAASASVAEEGYLIVEDLNTGSLESSTNDTYTLSGAVSVAAGLLYHQITNLEGMTSTAARLWVAGRETSFESNLDGSGWSSIPLSYTTVVTISGVVPEFKALRRNNTEAESTYYLNNGASTVPVVLLDWYLVSGTFAAGTAVVRLTFETPELLGAPIDITTSFDMFSDSGALTKLADVTSRMTLNYLPGLPNLLENSSRYEFKTANFYAADSLDAVYAVNGAGRGFIFDQNSVSFIYTQEDSTKDKPRHVEVHHLHLALGFSAGSVLLSVVGEPYNFSGVQGASEIAVGDRITGLMELEGTTLGVFCEESIWAVVGTSVDNFQTQVITPNTGCIEYTLANCGFPVYLDSRGISTLETSARYGDFVGQRLSSPVSPWLIPRCRKALANVNNSTGVACALPIRTKNQYRLFFNDGEILTTTFVVNGDGGNGVAFTFQRYYLEQPTITDTDYKLIPICSTSQVDNVGVERVFVAHYNEESPVQSNHVFALESGDSFDGKYIPHMFETNWYFGNSPTMYRGLQKIRMHGLSKGKALIDVYSAGIDNDYGFGTNIFQSTPEPLNLPRTAVNDYNELLPATNIANLANRGLGIQLRFKGRNTDLTQPEPGHILQVMVIYSRPSGGPDA